LAVPAFLLSIPTPSMSTSNVSFEQALWEFSACDVVLQGLVILTVALGISIVLHERKKRGRKTLAGAA